MKRIVFIMALLLTAGVAMAAHSFTALAPSGQTLYFSYTAGGVMLTFPANTNVNTQGWDGYTKPTGALTLPSTVTNGGQTYAVVAIHKFAFYGCTGLTSVVVPEGVTAIRQAAFSGCTSLADATLPSTLDSLGNTAFYGCPLATLTCNASLPPVAGNTSFGNVPLATCSLLVPCSAIGDYSTTSPWSNFQNISSMGCTVTVVASANYADRGTVSGGGSYNTGTAVMLNALPSSGYFFACWSDGDTNNPRIVTLTADTAFMALFFALQHDTVTVTQHDTVVQHDTVTVVTVRVDTLWQYDTVYTTVYDTVTLHDSIMPTFFRLQVTSTGGGVGVGSSMLPAGCEVEIAALPLEGYRFTSWHDGSTDNPRRVTLTGDATYTADFETLGVGSVENEKGWSLAAEGRSVVVGGACGERVALYDLQGRRLFATVAEGDRLVMRMTAAGVYLVTVGGGAARKIVVE
ncbi:MAG: leucine-rich repeat domain-containing protein [Bacteroidales bacterium]|nr:leucine-rich repeat domain-containing protein [Bacteroidales bacterium]